MKISNLNELFLHELKDVYDAENQLVEALPKLAEKAKNPQLAEAFRNHLKETRQHVARLEAVFKECGEEAERETCKGMKGLIAEGEKMMKEDADPDVMDAGLISAAQRVEHYEIAAYGTLRVWAATIGLDGALKQIEATLEEEKAADEKLTEIAEGGVNADAESGEEAEDSGSRKSATTRSRADRPARSRRTSKSTR